MARCLLFLAFLSSLVAISSQQSCQTTWGQCGGIGWTGSTCCSDGAACSELNSYYYQCIPGTATSTASATTSPTYTGLEDYTTSTSIVPDPTHTQSPYPSANSSSCSSWTLVDNVCCPAYCTNNNESTSCDGTCPCGTPPAEDCMSGTMYPEVFSVNSSEPWHYSRSTHFGLTDAGACGFGMYGLCTVNSTTASWTDPLLGDTCTAFCTAYPQLCADPEGITLRGNFAAPDGDYYTQFWPSQPGDWDNYLSCGECMEMVMTYPNGSLYQPGDPGYTPPLIVTIVDSCPCDANPKWCCGPGADHCGEIDFTYGCPLPNGSIHLDLSDIAMGRLQGNGSLAAGVIPTQYRRVPCPTLGNVYLWLQSGAGEYWFSVAAVNSYGIGSLVALEVLGAGDTAWTALERNPDYTTSRPQERYGAWTVPSGAGPFSLPIGVRLTSAAGEQIVNMEAITTWTPPATAPEGFYYIDLGVQFTM